MFHAIKEGHYGRMLVNIYGKVRAIRNERSHMRI